MLKAIRVSVLLLTLTGAAHAGEIIIPPAPQSVRTSNVQEDPENNEDTSPANEETSEETVSLTQIALTVLVSLLP